MIIINPIDIIIHWFSEWWRQNGEEPGGKSRMTLTVYVAGAVGIVVLIPTLLLISWVIGVNLLLCEYKDILSS